MYNIINNKNLEEIKERALLESIILKFITMIYIRSTKRFDFVLISCSNIKIKIKTLIEIAVELEICIKKSHKKFQHKDLALTVSALVN